MIQRRALLALTRAAAPASVSLTPRSRDRAELANRLAGSSKALRPIGGVSMTPICLLALGLCLAALTPAAAQQDECGTVYKPADGITPPVVVKQVNPQYTAEALDAKIQGKAVLEGVGETDGSIDESTVTTSIDEGLDAQAVDALRQWQFKPGQKDRKAVRVLLTVELWFTLRDKRWPSGRLSSGLRPTAFPPVPAWRRCVLAGRPFTPVPAARRIAPPAADVPSRG